MAPAADNRVLSFSEGLDISFHRTTRVPDHEDPTRQTVLAAEVMNRSAPCDLTPWPLDGDGKSYLLALDCPPGLALDRLEAFGIRASTERLAKRGVKLEIKIEGQNIAVPNDSHLRLRQLCYPPPVPGSSNSLSQRSMQKMSERQSYFFLPNPESGTKVVWVDGIAAKVNPRLVRQFVVRNDGKGASLQHQVTGEVDPDKMGIVEIEATFPASLVCTLNIRVPTRFTIKEKTREESVVTDIPPFSISHVDTTALVSTLALRIAHEVRTYLTRRHGDGYEIRWPDIDHLPLSLNSMYLFPPARLERYNIRDGDTIDVVGFREDSVGSLHPYLGVKTLGLPLISPGRLEVVPGGLIHQPLPEDPGVISWDSRTKAIFTVRIVNFEQFRKLTGREPPVLPGLPLNTVAYPCPKRNRDSTDGVVISNAEYMSKYPLNEVDYTCATATTSASTSTGEKLGASRVGDEAEAALRSMRRWDKFKVLARSTLGGGPRRGERRG